MSRFGIRRKVKAALKAAIGFGAQPRPAAQPPPSPPPVASPPAHAPASPRVEDPRPLFARGGAHPDDPAGKGRLWVQVRGLGPDAMQVGSVRRVEVFGRRWALARIEEGYFAVQDRCPHAGGSLAEGKLEGTLLSCPRHGWTFDVRDGTGQAGTSGSVECAAVRVQDGKVFVESNR